MGKYKFTLQDFEAAFSQAPNEVKLVYTAEAMTRQGFPTPIGISTYEKALKDYPEYFVNGQISFQKAMEFNSQHQNKNLNL